MKILIAGATGFIGRNAIEFYKDKYELKSISYREKEPCDEDFDQIDVVLFFTGIAHAMDQLDSDIYYKVNRDLAVSCSETAMRNGVKHFIYLSSTKVYGDEEFEYLDEKSPTKANDAYGKSKKEAEELLLGQSTENYKVAIIRPCLVYGKGVKGNLNNLIKLINKTPILPFGKITNRRSMVNVKNLLSLIEKILEKKAKGIFIATDENPYSTSQLIETIAKVSNKQITNFRLPSILRFLLNKVKPQVYSRLFGSYFIEAKNTNNSIDFKPSYTLEEGLLEMIKFK